MLTIYAPFNNKNSKAYEVFNGVQKSWPEQTTMFDKFRSVIKFEKQRNFSKLL